MPGYFEPPLPRGAGYFDYGPRRCTNGTFGWRLGQSIALGMVRPDLGEIGSELDITILGKPHRARVVEESPFDPENARLRA